MRGIAAVVATAFASAAASGCTTAWVDALELVVRGRGFDSAICDLPYSRLSKAAQGVVTDAVWNLQRDSAGQFVQFVSDSSALSVNATCARVARRARTLIRFSLPLSRALAPWRWMYCACWR
jgi:hypothetical protein